MFAEIIKQYAGTPRGKEMGLEGMESAPPPLENWLRLRLEELGVESGDDLALLTSEDLLPDELPFHLRGTLDKEFPLRVDLGDSLYEAVYDEITPALRSEYHALVADTILERRRLWRCRPHRA